MTEPFKQNGDGYRHLVERVPVITYIQRFGEPNRTTYVSPQVEGVLGYSPSDLIGETRLWVDTVHPEDRQRVLAAVVHAIATDEPFRAEYRQLAKDGRVVWVRDEATVARGEAGNHRFWIGVITDDTERKKAEEALRFKTSRLAALIENLQVGILVEDGSRCVSHVNQEFCAMFGVPVSPQAFIGTDCSNSAEETKELFADPDGFVRRIEVVLSERQTVTGEELLLADGRVFERDYVPIFVEAEYLGHLWQYKDITERKRTETRHRETEAKYRTLVEQVPAIIYIEDAETGATLYNSPQIEEILGYPQDTCIEDPFYWDKILHPDDRQQVRVKEVQAETNDGFSIEYRVMAHDGRLVWLQDDAVLIRDEEGQPRFWQGIIFDVTERKKFEKEQREADERFREAFDSAPIGMAIVDLEGRYLQVNRALCEILGYSEDELLAATYKDITYPEDEEISLEYARRIEEGEIDTYHLEKRYVHAEGHPVWVSLSVSLVKDSENQPLHFISKIQDITERKLAEEELRESEKRYRRQAMELSLLDQVRTALARELELSEVFHTVVEAIARTYGYTLVSAYLLKGEELVLQHQVGYESVIERVSTDKGIMGRVARTGQAVLLRDVRSDPAFLGAVEGIVSEVCVPLLHEGGIVGTLNVESTEGVELTEDDLRLMTALGEHVNIAINRSRLYTRMRESEERYRALIRYGADGISILEIDGTIRYESPAAERVLGYRPEDMVGTNGFSYLHPDDFERVLELFVEGIETNLPTATEEVRFRAADGSWVYLEMTGVNLLDDPDVEGIIVTSHDITERKHVEESLRRSEAGLAEAQRMTHLGNWAWDVKTGEVYWSNETFRIFGYEPQEFVPYLKKFMEGVHPEDRKMVRENIDAALYRGKPYDFEHRIVRPDGEVRVVYRRAEVIFDEEGEPWRMIGTVHDVTEHERAEKALQESEARLRTVVQSLGEGLLITDPRDVILYVNPRLTELTGYTEEEVLGRPAYELLLPPEQWPEMLRRDKERMEGVSERYEVHLKRKDGSFFWAETNATPYRDASGEIVGTLGAITDITERRLTEEALKESEERFRQLFEQSVDAVFVHDERGRLVDCNSQACRLLGYTREELLDLTVHDLSHNMLTEEERELKERNGGTLWQRVTTGEPGMFAFSHEEVNQRKDGTTFPVEVRVGSVDYGGRRMILASLRDITERKMFEAQLTYQALHDSLTDLPNRALFLDRLEQAIAQTRRYEEVMVAVLFMDLDNFKNVNDSLGHEVGDELLKAVANRVQGCMRPGDTAARLGGDEFAILLEDVKSVRDAVWVADRLIDVLRAPFNLRGHEVFVTTSIGISLSASGQDRAEAMLRDADLAMYKAKEKGKANYQVFDPVMYYQILERLKLERDLRRAIDQDEFVIHYQPKVSLKTGGMIGVEALVRWKHPERGLVSPEEFVPVAEETGLIIPIGYWTLEEACRQASEWQERHDRDLFQIMSVNVSASQLQLPELLEEVSSILEKTGLDPRSLILEITESVVMSEASSNIVLLDELRKLGIKLAIDDFGTGYSSLAYLKRFPVSYLKIDRSFVDELREDPEDTAVVAGMIALAHTLGMEVIAEGVETSEQLRILREMDCDIAQGHYFSEALAHEALSDFLAADPHW